MALVYIKQWVIYTLFSYNQAKTQAEVIKIKVKYSELNNIVTHRHYLYLFKWHGS
jgi:hypothetical protein